MIFPMVFPMVNPHPRANLFRAKSRLGIAQSKFDMLFATPGPQQADAGPG